jgi:polysaccharide export outer membrane protein
MRVLSPIVVAGLLAGCTTVSNLPPAPHDLNPTAGFAPSLPAYRLNVGDVIGVRLLLNPELNEDVAIRPDGKVSTMVAQDISAYGHTVAEVSRELRAAYAQQLNDPHLSIEVRNFAPNRVYVGGEVTNPGEFITVGPNLTLVQAIARAGGVKLSAGRGSIFIIRRGEGDVPIIYRADYMDAITGKDPSADVRLAPFDVVYVPRTGVAEVYTYFNQYVQQFVPVNWGFNYNVNPIATTPAP